ncbi:DUF4142 domain-containing protein [Paenalcaligenes niemegkensis]|uniref:DUF4142 domain-containing protein n=1 Tax=Paenalcaligenes niemegkensis TaxID=2895469 RepID=UPI001EE96DE3|nr:DUF4142 domain-containing protein [Paenalcaligenes niemegkensis]MCQ9615790.1 DUF4142 domain-containing protein [Paenalcaligenes niemegkensis]
MRAILLTLFFSFTASIIPTGSQAQDLPLTDDEQNFVHAAHKSNLFELQASELAEQNTSNPDVQKFAKQMLTDHGKTNARLVLLAKEHYVTLDVNLLPEHQQIIGALSDLKDDDFDQMYVEEVGIKAHENAVRTFRRGAPQLVNASLQRFNVETLAVISEHFEHAKSLQQKLAAQ